MDDMGTLDFKYSQFLRSDFQRNLIFDPKRPTFNLKSTGISPPHQGTGGVLELFLSLLTAVLITTKAFNGTEIICVAACEAKYLRKVLPEVKEGV